MIHSRKSTSFQVNGSTGSTCSFSKGPRKHLPPPLKNKHLFFLGFSFDFFLNPQEDNEIVEAKAPSWALPERPGTKMGSVKGSTKAVCMGFCWTISQRWFPSRQIGQVTLSQQILYSHKSGHWSILEAMPFLDVVLGELPPLMLVHHFHFFSTNWRISRNVDATAAVVLSPPRMFIERV